MKIEKALTTPLNYYRSELFGYDWRGSMEEATFGSKIFLTISNKSSVSVGLLKPLGRPARNGHKFLCADCQRRNRMDSKLAVENGSSSDEFSLKDSLKILIPSSVF